MTDEQKIALAHLRRIELRLKDVPVTEKVALAASQLFLLAEDVLEGDLMRIQERARVTLGLLDPS